MKRTELWAAALAALLALGLLIGGSRGAVETGSWGLSFSGEGAAPRAPESTAILTPLDAVYLDGSGEKTVYLTFDAGYENGYTESILDTLKEKQVPAAFFLVGHYLDTQPDLVRRMADEGHTVGNHTLTHPDMSAVTDSAAFARELSGLEEKYRQITGAELPKYYRPPQGLYSLENLEMAKEFGYTTVFWSLAYADWDNQNQPEPAAAVEKLTARLHPGAIVLLHSTSETNAKILGKLIDDWRALGYEFRSLEDLTGG